MSFFFTNRYYPYSFPSGSFYSISFVIQAFIRLGRRFEYDVYAGVLAT